MALSASIVPRRWEGQDKEGRVFQVALRRASALSKAWTTLTSRGDTSGVSWVGYEYVRERNIGEKMKKREEGRKAE